MYVVVKMPNIHVSDETYKELVKAKACLEMEEEKLVSFDRLIMTLLSLSPKAKITFDVEEE